MFQIFAEKPNGDIFECFTWTGPESLGIQRAYRDAEEHGVEVTKVWAERIEQAA